MLRRLRVSLVRRGWLELEGRREAALVIDLGLRGAFVEHPQPPPRGTPVSLRFTLPGNEIEVAVRGRVAWCQAADGERLPAGLGVEFTELAETDRERVRRFLAEHYHRAPRARQFTRPWPEEPFE